jgi:hypothetical protein
MLDLVESKCAEQIGNVTKSEGQAFIFRGKILEMRGESCISC